MAHFRVNGFKARQGFASIFKKVFPRAPCYLAIILILHRGFKILNPRLCVELCCSARPTLTDDQVKGPWEHYGHNGGNFGRALAVMEASDEEEICPEAGKQLFRPPPGLVSH